MSMTTSPIEFLETHTIELLELSPEKHNVPSLKFSALRLAGDA